MQDAVFSRAISPCDNGRFGVTTHYMPPPPDLRLGGRMANEACLVMDSRLPMRLTYVGAIPWRCSDMDMALPKMT